MSATTGQRSEADHEKVETREGHHVDGELAQVRVQLTGETQGDSDTGHNGRHQVVEVAVGGVGQLQRAHADVVESLVVNAEGLVGVLNQLVDGEGGVVGLDNGIGDLGGGHDGEGGHHAVGELLADLGDQQSAHTSTGTTTQGVGDLEALEAVTTFSLTTDNVQNLVDQLSTLGVVTLGPVVAGTGLAEDEVVGTEELAKGAGADGIHGTGLEVDQDGTGDVLVAGGLVEARKKELSGSKQHARLATALRVENFRSTYLVEVNIHALELELRGAVVAVRSSVEARGAWHGQQEGHTRHCCRGRARQRWFACSRGQSQCRRVGIVMSRRAVRCGSWSCRVRTRRQHRFGYPTKRVSFLLGEYSRSSREEDWR